MQTTLLSGLCLLLLVSHSNAIRYESEDHHNVGAASIIKGLGSGSAHVHHEEIGAATTFTVFVENDDHYSATIGHLSSHGAIYHVSVNGLDTQQISLAQDAHDVTLKLRRGSNLVTLEKRSDHISKLDFIEVPLAFAANNRGAPVSYQTYEAESASHNGRVIGPDRTFGTLPSEASGRKAVQISRNQFVEFTLSKAAEGIVVRFSIPDSGDGNGLQAPLEVSGPNVGVNLTLTSKYSWVYGQFPFTNRPSDKSPHHFYDEIRQMFSGSVPAGSKVRLTSRSNTVVTVDMAEFHQIPQPYAQNGDVLSILDYGADATGNRDSSDAIQKAMNAFAGKGKKGIFMPKGRYLVSRHFFCKNIIVGGAGPWHTVVYTKTKANFGFLGAGQGAQLYDFSLVGATTQRIDSDWDNALGGDMSRGTAHNIWVEHVKVGVWMEGNVDGFLGNGLIIRNTWADGINFHKGITNSVVQNSDIRNTGDDCLAVWSGDGLAKNNKFNHNTVKLPMLANTIAIYGGQDNQAVGNYLADTVSSGSCIHIGNRFKALPLAGTTLAQDNTMERCGSPNYNRPGHSGAVWIFPEDSPINSAVQITDSDVSDSFSAAFSVFTGTVNNLLFNNVNVNGGQYVLELSGISGSATLSNIRAQGLKSVGVASCVNNFNVKKGSGNSGWDTTKCLNF